VATNGARVWAALITLVPVGLVLGLLNFGQFRTEPTPRRVFSTFCAAVLLGPVAVLELGFFMWLVGVVTITGCLALLAALRVPRHPVGH
jgi:hypothetical protein